MPPGRSSRYVSVQALRGLAAMLVVLIHAMESARDHLGSGYVLYSGAAGVDIFFAISGFIMVVTTASSWGAAGAGASFMRRRLMRLVPLYWLATGIRLGLLLAVPGLVRHTKLHLWHTIASFLFIPAWNFEHLPVPLLPVGWTLSYELLFYILFAAALMLSRHPIRWATAFLLVAVGIGYFQTSAWGAAPMILNSLLIEFIFGMAIGYATLHGIRFSKGCAGPILLFAFVALLATDIARPGSPPRFILWGIPAALILLASVSVEEHVAGPLAGLPNTLGDASYAIYLFHVFAIEAMWVTFDKLHLTPHVGDMTAILSGTVVSAIVGLAAHFYLEKPMMQFIRSKSSSRRVPPATAVPRPEALVPRAFES